MRIGIFSDVHANIEAMNAVADAFKSERIDKYVCIGDVVGYGASPNECCDLIRKLDMVGRQKIDADPLGRAHGVVGARVAVDANDQGRWIQRERAHRSDGEAEPLAVLGACGDADAAGEQPHALLENLSRDRRFPGHRCVHDRHRSTRVVLVPSSAESGAASIRISTLTRLKFYGARLARGSCVQRMALSGFRNGLAAKRRHGAFHQVADASIRRLRRSR